MSAIGDFPLYPTNGQIYTNDYGFSWRWNGNTSIRAWEKYVRSVTSFNGITGDVQGVSAAVAGTGISVSGATGSVTITNTGVQSIGGVTGAVTYLDCGSL